MYTVLPLQAITNLEGDTFVKAWIDSVRGHYALWKAGIQHQRSPSLERLTYHEEGAVTHGAVVDWDLPAHDLGGCELTTGNRVQYQETIPFTPAVLLVHEYWAGQIPRTYEHDMESFVWILVWVFMRYDGTKTVEAPPLQVWSTGDWQTCRRYKTDFLTRSDTEIRKMQPCWQDQAELASGAINFAAFRCFSKVIARKVSAQAAPEAPEDVYRLYWDKMKEVYPAITTWDLATMEE